MLGHRTVLLIATVSWWAAACNGEQRIPKADPSPPPVAEEAPPAPAPSPAAPAADAPISLEGTVVKKPWSKSAESWNAGGSDYFVLESADGASTILRPTEQVTAADLEAAAGKRVRVRGTRVPLTEYKPAHPTEQYPIGPDGRPLPRGGGLSVTGLDRL